MSGYQLFKRTRNIRKAASQMRPDSVWIEQTRKTLLMQVQNSQPAPVKATATVNRAFKIFMPVISFKWMRTPAAIASAVIIALFGGSFFSVSASEQALPGDFLYSIKLASEQARMAMVKSPDERVKLKTEFTERRVTEMKQVIDGPRADKSDRVKQAADVLKRDMNTIKNQLEEVKNTSSPEMAKQTATLVDERIAALIADLQSSKIKLSAAERVKLSEAQAAASDTSLKAIEVLLKTHFENAEVVTEAELIEFLKNYNAKVTKTVTESTGIKSDTQVPLSATTSSSSGISLTDSSSTKSNASTTVDGTATTDSSSDKMQEVTKSLSDADKQADEKNLNEALELSKVGTQQAFAVQKTFEEDAAKQESDAQKAINTGTTAEPPTTDQPTPETEATTTSVEASTTKPVITN
jgi:hypothetical protein